MNGSVRRLIDFNFYTHIYFFSYILSLPLNLSCIFQCVREFLRLPLTPYQLSELSSMKYQISPFYSIQLYFHFTMMIHLPLTLQNDEEMEGKKKSISHFWIQSKLTAHFTLEMSSTCLISFNTFCWKASKDEETKRRTRKRAKFKKSQMNGR